MRALNKLNIVSIVSIILILGLMSSCKSKKDIVSVGGVIVEKSEKELLNDINNKQLNYKTVSGKTKFELSAKGSKRDLKVTAVIKMIKDETIQISLRAKFGFEVALITLSPDSIYMIDRYNKKYGVDNINKFASSNSTFNYYNLQSLLTNAVFVPGEKEMKTNSAKKFNLSTTSDLYLLKTKDASNVLYNFAVDGNSKLASTLIYSPEKFTLQWSYKNFIEDGVYTYPTTMDANLEVKSHRLDIKISYDKLDIDQPIEISDPVPSSSKYQKIKISDFLKQYMGL